MHFFGLERSDGLSEQGRTWQGEPCRPRSKKTRWENMGNWRTQLHTREKMRNGTRKHRERQPVGTLKKTGFPGSENWRDVPQLTFLFQALMHDMVNYFLPSQCTMHSKSGKEGIIFLWMCSAHSNKKLVILGFRQHLSAKPIVHFARIMSSWGRFTCFIGVYSIQAK